MMTDLLVMVAVYTILGGMLSVLVTDFLQFVVMSVGLIAVTLLILVNVGWDKLAATVTEKHGPGGFNPFVHADLGWPYVLFTMLVTTASTLTWQTSIARVLAAKDTQTGEGLLADQLLFCVPISDSRFVGHRGVGVLRRREPATRCMRCRSISPGLCRSDCWGCWSQRCWPRTCRPTRRTCSPGPA